MLNVIAVDALAAYLTGPSLVDASIRLSIPNQEKAAQLYFALRESMGIRGYVSQDMAATMIRYAFTGGLSVKDRYEAQMHAASQSSWCIQREMRDGGFSTYQEGYSRLDLAKAAVRRVAGGYSLTWRCVQDDTNETWEGTLVGGPKRDRMVWHKKVKT